jgi:Protein of unknown function (DUF3137)
MSNPTEYGALQAQFAPILDELEAERLLIVNRNYSILAVSAGIMVGGGLIALNLGEPPIAIGSVVLGFLIYVFSADKGADKWVAKYKEDVIGTIVHLFFGEQGVYEASNGHSESEFVGTELFTKEPDRYHSEDLIKGKVDKTAIAFSEVHAEYKTTSSKGQTSWHTIFRGMLFTADFNKHFNGRTIVKEKGFWDFIAFGNIDLENPQFNKKFGVYTDDSIEARYILSPALMEKMLLLNQNWGSSLGFSFIRSQLTIAIPMDANFFEVSVWSKIDSDSKWLNDWQIIADLVSVVHDLDLNTRIWTKE